MSNLPNKTLCVKDLAEDIMDKDLYFVKEGLQVTAVQIRARANEKFDKFNVNLKIKNFALNASFKLFELY